MPIYNGYDDKTRLRSLSGKTPTYDRYATTEINLAKANNQDENMIWYTEVFSDRMLINLLLLLIGKSTNTQKVFGYGFYSSEDTDVRISSGTMNSKGLFWGVNTKTKTGVKVFGIEHWWGNQFRRIGGYINNKGNIKVKMTYGQSDGSTVDGYNTDGTGYISTNCTPTGTTRGYITKMAFTEYGLIPTNAKGSATTYYADSLWYNNSLTVGYATTGGSCNYDLSAGAFCLALNNNATTDYSKGTASSLSCKPLALIEEVE